MLVGLVAIVVLAGVRAFGSTVDGKADRQAACVRSLGGECSGLDQQPYDPGAIPSAPALPAAVSADAAYEQRLRDSLATLETHFDAIAGDDGRIDQGDLQDALNSRDADVRDAAAFFLESSSARYAADVGAGRGDVDGDISLDDVRGLSGSLDNASVATLLADTAQGDGGRDGDISRDDLAALAADPGAPPEIRAWAEARLAEMPEDQGCSGWSDFGCHISDAAGWAYDTTGLDSVVDHSGLDSAAHWVDESIYQNLPGPIRTAWDFGYGFNVLGPVRVVTGVVDGVGGVLSLGQTYVESFIDDPAGTFMATVDFATNPATQAQFAYTLGNAIVHDYAERCTSSASEAGACGFEVALEVALAVTTGGGGNAATHVDDLRYTRYLDDVDDVADAARVTRHLDDLPPPEFGWQHVNIGDGPGSRSINCSRCAIAVDSTLEGAPASALGITEDGLIGIDRIAQHLGRAPDAWVTRADRAAVQTSVEEWGHGSKGVVYIARDDGTAHVFNVVNDQGDVLFIDGQTGRLGDVEFTEHVTDIQILRTNDWTVP